MGSWVLQHTRSPRQGKAWSLLTRRCSRGESADHVRVVVPAAGITHASLEPALPLSSRSTVVHVSPARTMVTTLRAAPVRRVRVRALPLRGVRLAVLVVERLAIPRRRRCRRGTRTCRAGAAVAPAVRTGDPARAELRRVRQGRVAVSGRGLHLTGIHHCATESRSRKSADHVRVFGPAAGITHASLEPALPLSSRSTIVHVGPARTVVTALRAAPAPRVRVRDLPLRGVRLAVLVVERLALAQSASGSRQSADHVRVVIPAAGITHASLEPALPLSSRSTVVHVSPARTMVTTLRAAPVRR